MRVALFEWLWLEECRDVQGMSPPDDNSFQTQFSLKTMELVTLKASSLERSHGDISIGVVFGEYLGLACKLRYLHVAATIIFVEVVTTFCCRDGQGAVLLRRSCGRTTMLL